MHLYFLVLLVLLLIGVFAYVWTLCWVARRRVTTEPRKELMTCDKHGPFPKEYAYDVYGAVVCPMCFEDSIKAAGKS